MLVVHKQVRPKGKSLDAFKRVFESIVGLIYTFTFLVIFSFGKIKILL